VRPLEFAPPEDHPRAAVLDFSRFLRDSDPDRKLPRKCAVERNDRPGISIDEEVLGDCRAAFEGETVEITRQVGNMDRAIGRRISCKIYKLFVSQVFDDGLINCNINGLAGQSLGAFLSKGVEIHLEGEANDYVGKGMGGGLIAIRPPEASRFPSQESSILRNAVLYGATGGELFAAGRASDSR
jgi:glutamate synthase domain-containing protein 3